MVYKSPDLFSGIAQHLAFVSVEKEPVEDRPTYRQITTPVNRKGGGGKMRQKKKRGSIKRDLYTRIYKVLFDCSYISLKRL